MTDPRQTASRAAWAQVHDEMADGQWHPYTDVDIPLEVALGRRTEAAYAAFAAAVTAGWLETRRDGHLVRLGPRAEEMRTWGDAASAPQPVTLRPVTTPDPTLFD